MNPIRVGILGYDAIGKRVADAVLLQPDMRLMGVYETDPVRTELLRRQGISQARSDLAAWMSACHAIVNAAGSAPPDAPVSVIHGPASRHRSAVLALPGVSLEGRPHIKVPCADALLMARLITALAPLRPFTRLFSSCARRAGHATARSASVDSLKPIFGLPEEDAELDQALRPWVASWRIQRTYVPYTHSHLHMIKLDCTAPPDAEQAVALLRRSSRILTSAIGADLTDTGRVQEFFRDRRPRGDRPEVFVWEESVSVVGSSLVLMADVTPEAAPIPEMIDAIRLCRSPQHAADTARITDQALGLGGR